LQCFNAALLFVFQSAEGRGVKTIIRVTQTHLMGITLIVTDPDTFNNEHENK
ncbi:hypothetical protein M9458_038986, partial [Cirrhinus mrigala]